MTAKVRSLRFTGGGTLTFVEGRARRHVVSGEAFSVGSDELAETLLADPVVIDLDAPAPEAETPDVPEETGYGAMTVPALRELAAKRGLEVASDARKADLVAAHVAADDATAGEPVAPAPEAETPSGPEANTGGAVTLGDMPDSAKVRS